MYIFVYIIAVEYVCFVSEDSLAQKFTPSSRQSTMAHGSLGILNIKYDTNSMFLGHKHKFNFQTTNK